MTAVYFVAILQSQYYGLQNDDIYESYISITEKINK